MFIAIEGEHFNAHHFINNLVEQGGLFFIVNHQFTIYNNDVSYIKVKNTLKALQRLAAYHRKQFNYPVIGITGSNGKTIIKEWLYQLLSQDYSIVKSPKSYNSQVGVPLSVINMNTHHSLGIFEAGISTTNEMKKLEPIIQPSIGVFTNLGSAHNEGFKNNLEKLYEKIQLFEHTRTIIVEEDTMAHQLLQERYPTKQLIAWHIKKNKFRYKKFKIELPSTLQRFQQENLAHCIATLIYLGIHEKDITTRIEALKAIENRLQISQAKNNVTVINDSYNNDLAGLEIALKYAHQQADGQPFSAVISFIEQSGLTNQATQEKIINLLKPYHINQLVLLGKEFQQIEQNKTIHYCSNKDDLTTLYKSLTIHNEVLLVKGARKYQLETFVNSIHKKLHDTVWEINLSAFMNNINVFKQMLHKNVKMMVMVKAFAYGSSPKQLAKLLQHQHIDYLGVAYPSEGKELREFGIQTPIMVMNTSELTFQTAIEAKLEIETYSIEHLTALIEHLNENAITNYPIHLKIDTGMHRLGFEQNDIEQLIQLIAQPETQVKGIFSHLATSDEIDQTFAEQQQQQFDEIVAQITPHCSTKPIIHLLNSNGLANTRLPQYDMVRLGIGAYGISANNAIHKKLIQIGTLKATISQIKEVKTGESVGYSRAFKAKQTTKIATITIGYADGFDRRFSNGVGKVLINNKLAPVIGNVCMDMTMIDISNINNVSVGDEVIITSPQLPITELANSIGTISYELLTKVSPRIARIFVTE